MKSLFVRMGGLIVLSFSFSLLFAQPRHQYSSAEIQHSLLGLRTLGSVLYWAAHPDDENTRVIAYLSRGKHYRTAYFSLTRGDGGQNLIGTEQDYLLGILRTQELLAARRIDGGEQYFSRAWDFGFSKNPEETFQKWTRETVLADAVWMIRRFRPDVIITRFPPDSRAGHGHHTASAMLAEEAFKLAADSTAFPEQLKYVSTWQPTRLLWNTNSWFFGSAGFKTDSLLKLNVGEYDPLYGESYAEMAAEARSQHRCQAFGTARERGALIEYLQHTAGSRAQTDLMEGVKSSWRDYGLIKIDKMLELITNSFNPLYPEEIVPALLKVRQEMIKTAEMTRDAQAKFWLYRKLSVIEELVAQCSGLWFEALADVPYAASGDSLKVKIVAVNRGKNELMLNGTLGTEAFQWDTLSSNVAFAKDVKISLSGLVPTQPWWLHLPVQGGTFSLPDSIPNRQHLIGLPETPAPLKALFSFRFPGYAPVNFEVPVVHKFVDRSIGELYRPFVVAPEITLTPMERVFVWASPEARTVTFRVQAHTDIAQANLQFSLPEGWKMLSVSEPLTLKKGEEKMIAVQILPPPAASEGKLHIAAVLSSGKAVSKGLQIVQYEHIPTQMVFPESEVKVVYVPLKKQGTNIAYIQGSGDEVPAGLRQIGYTVTLLEEQDITPDNLRKFDAVICGIRLYNTLKTMPKLHPYLMQYVEQGGTCIIQYNTNYDLSMNIPGPYPFKITRNRVTVEEAPVSILAKDHPAIVGLNPLTNSDFDGWIQERGLYFAGEWDSRYTPVLSMGDPNEPADKGALLYAAHGKGHFYYTGLSFFREIPAGVPGAYKLLVNMLNTH